MEAWVADQHPIGIDPITDRDQSNMSQPDHQNLSDPSPTEAHFSTANDSPELPAWTEVDAGRFMPRRVRGSCQGRALG